jgi:uncharacterized Zn finger protein
MARETIHEKALRYLRERRVRVTRAQRQRVHARIRGERDVYDASFKRDARSWCTCPARVKCAHLLALELVAGTLTTVEARPVEAPPLTVTATAVTSGQPRRSKPTRDAYRHERHHNARVRDHD